MLFHIEKIHLIYRITFVYSIILLAHLSWQWKHGGNGGLNDENVIFLLKTYYIQQCRIELRFQLQSSQ